MKELQFILSVEETNLILEALGQRPFVQVHQLIGKIQQQAAQQLQEPPATQLKGKENGQPDIVKQTTAL